jgi:hypothetical protein
MPFLFWLPLIMMSGMWSVADDNSRAFKPTGDCEH